MVDHQLNHLTRMAQGAASMKGRDDRFFDSHGFSMGCLIKNYIEINRAFSHTVDEKRR